MTTSGSRSGVAKSAVLAGLGVHPGEALALGGMLGAVTLDRKSSYPVVFDPGRVGSYPASAGASGSYVWDAVLEYRVWCHPECGAPDTADGNDYYHAFATYEEALSFRRADRGWRVSSNRRRASCWR